MLATLPALAHAQGIPLKTTTGIEIGGQLSQYKYEEEVNNRFFMSLQGSKLGLVGSYARAYGDSLYWSVDGRFAAGNNHYKSAGTGEAGHNPDSYTDARVTVGRDFDVGSQVLSLYAGLGSRSLKSDLRGYTNTGAAGYRRSSHYLYLPLGVTHRFRLSEQARWATTLEYDHLIEGRQKSHMTDIVGYTSDLENQQNKGHGLRLNLAYETATWSVGMFYQAWSIDDSEMGTYTSTTTVYSGYEPKNTTREVGVQVRYRFH
jgi:hypothetical protein